MGKTLSSGRPHLVREARQVCAPRPADWMRSVGFMTGLAHEANAVMRHSQWA